MAEMNRSDRQLMRQRGAGLRNTQNVDFGLKFDNQGSREDRQLMRQRGAGNRMIDNVDFGFAFPTPSQSQRSSRTPQTRGRRSSEARSVRASSIEQRKSVHNHERRSKTPPRIIRIEQPNSSKKRRLNNDGQSGRIVLKPVVVNISLLRKSTLQSPVNTDVEQHEINKEALAIATPSKDFQRQPESPLFFPENDDIENVNPYPRSDFGSAMSKRANSVLSEPMFDEPSQGFLELRDRLVDSIEQLQPEPLLPAPREAEEQLEAGRNDYIISEQSSAEAVSTDSLNSTRTTAEPISKASKNRRKRKSVILGRKKRRSSQDKRANPLQQNRGIVVDVPAVTNLVVEKEPEVESVPDGHDIVVEKQAKNLPSSLHRTIIGNVRGKRSRLSVSTSPAPLAEVDEESDATYVEEEGTPEPMTPAPKKKKATSRTSRRSQEAENNTNQQVRPSRKSFPITTYRMTNVEALPTIIEEDEDNNVSDNDQPAILASFPNRPQPNAVDVFAQICRETIQSAITKLETNSTTSRAELKRKRTELETFSECLEQRLIDMSQAVEHRLTLEARLRKSKREKSDLQARWMEIRRQRDELALRADSIRRQNWENEEAGKRQWEISEIAHRTELEMERSDSQGNNLEFMLKQVASNVSSSGGNGGILNRVKLFNSKLERIAAALERHSN